MSILLHCPAAGFKKLGLDQGPTKRREEEGGNSRGEVPEGWGMHAGETGKWWSEEGMVLGPGTFA